MSLANSVEKFIESSDKAHQIVHGPAGTYVPTESGPVPSLSTAIGSISDVNQRLKAIEEGQGAGRFTVITYEALKSMVGAAGVGADVTRDPGTHVDPVTQLTVPNQGVYVWNTGLAVWQWVRADQMVSKADKSAVARGLSSVREPFNYSYMQQITTATRWRATAVNQRNELIAGHDMVTGALYCKLHPRNPSLRAAIGQQVAEMVSPHTVYVDSVRWRVWAMNSKGEILVGLNLETGEFIANIAHTGEAGPVLTDFHVYIQGGKLRATGGKARSWILNEDSGKTWLTAQVVGSTARAVYEDRYGVHSAVIALASGRLYRDGVILVMVDEGQSNREGQSGAHTSVVYGESFGDPDRIRMPMTNANNLWLGMTTSGGASLELAPNDITGLGPARSTVAPTGVHGTLAVEGAVRRLVRSAAAECDGWVPQVVFCTNGEGGQPIDRLLPTSEVGYHAAKNLRTLLTRLRSLFDAEGRAGVCPVIFMDQGDSDPADPTLGLKHDLLREDREDAYRTILGQTEPVRMFSGQQSSFQANKQGVSSILSHALEKEQPWGTFLCQGPTYSYPFTTDFLHLSSVGHAMKGEFGWAAFEHFLTTGFWRPLHMVSASVTGTNMIRVTLSEEAVVDEAWLVDAIANAGITLVGGAVSSVAVAGDVLTIQTAGAASAVTAVNSAYVGHPGTRSRATVPRSTIRSVASYGQWSAECGGRQMYKPLCHQTLPIT